MRLVFLMSSACLATGFIPSSLITKTTTRTAPIMSLSPPSNDASSPSTLRRTILLSPILTLIPSPPTFAAAEPTPLENSGLPPDAIRSYLQYRTPLQISADYYLFELKEQIGSLDSWGEVSSLFSSSNARGGQGQPSRIERDIINPMRIVSLSMPPDEMETMRDAQYKFEAAMEKIRKATAGVKRDLPVEVSPTLLPEAQKGWDDGRVAFNSFLTALNEATGLTNEMKTIPADKASYGRSERKYVELKKRIKLCQNRGGPTLSNAWGQLMVSGYLQDSCGIPDLEAYFFQ